MIIHFPHPPTTGSQYIYMLRGRRSSATIYKLDHPIGKMQLRHGLRDEGFRLTVVVDGGEPIELLSHPGTGQSSRGPVFARPVSPFRLACRKAVSRLFYRQL